MREIVDRDEPIHARGDGPRRGDRASSRRMGENYKAELIQRSAARARRSRSIARATGSTSAAARTCRSTGELGTGLQADEGRRRLLARRPPQRACCSASTAPPGATRRSSTPTCTSWRRRRSATTAGSAASMDLFHHPGRGGRQRVLASQGLDALPHRRGLHAPPARRGRLLGGEDAAAPRPRAVGGIRPLGEVPRAHVHRRRSRTRTSVLAVKPMNCPGHVQIFRQGTAVLPRAAAAHGRVRLLPPLRALGRAARHHAGARLHPGRRPYLLHRGPDRRGDASRSVDLLSLGLPRLRLRRRPRSSSPTGRRSAPAPTRSGTRPRRR